MFLVEGCRRPGTCVGCEPSGPVATSSRWGVPRRHGDGGGEPGPSLVWGRSADGPARRAGGSAGARRRRAVRR